MADLADIKKAGEELVPLIKELVALAKAGKDRDDPVKEIRVINKLKKLTAEADEETSASMQERAEAMIASHTALTEILIEAALNRGTVSDIDLINIRARHDALGNAIGLLFEQSAIGAIRKLMTQDEIDIIADSLKKADEDIAARRQAKAVLDTIIGVAMTGAKIATKLATL